jgi:hypothetical protein
MEQDRLGFLFGVFAGVLLFIAALFIVLAGLANLALNGFSTRLFLNSTADVILAVVLGLLFIFFSVVAARPSKDSALTGGVILMVLSVGTWWILGLHLFEALAGLFGLIGGILFIVAHR